jgi:hypothetical protein
MEERKKYKKVVSEKRMTVFGFLIAALVSSMIILSPSDAFAAKKYNPSGKWFGANEVVGGALSISMYTDNDGEIVGNWELANYYGFEEGIIKKTSKKNQYQLINAFEMNENNAGSVCFVMKMKSNKKLKLTPRKYFYKDEWKQAGFSGTFKLSQRYKS